jgi:hypothetical protein
LIQKMFGDKKGSDAAEYAIKNSILGDRGDALI